MADFKNFKIKGEDEKSYKLLHPKGHEFNVEKKGLSDKAHKAIQGLKGYDEGGTISIPEQPADAADAPPPAVNINLNAAPNQLASSVPNIPSNVQPDPSAQPTPGNMGAVAVPPQAVAQAAQVNGPQAPVPAVPGSNVNPMIAEKSDYLKIIEKEQKDAQALADAQMKEAGAQAGAWKSYNAKYDELATPQEIFDADKEGNDALFKSYMAKSVDPDRYVKNMGTTSKILSGIGMLISGAGSGVTKQSNMAMDNLNKHIQNDIDAQKNDQSKAFNLWHMNQQQYQNEQQADLATRNQMLTGVQAKIAQAQANMNGPLAQARANQVINDLEKQKVQNRSMMSVLQQGEQQGAGAGATQPGLSGIDPAILVPTYIKDPAAQKAALEEIKNRQNVSLNGQKILAAFDQAAKDTSGMGAASSLAYTPGSIMSLHQLMLPNFKTIDGTVRQAAMDESFHNVTPSGMDTADRLASKRQALHDWMVSESASPMTHGASQGMIDLDKYSKTALPSGIAPPKVQYMNGVPYKLSPDGKTMLRVK